MLRNTGDFRFGVMSPYDPGLQVVWPWLLPMSWEVRAVLPLRRLQPQARRVYRRLRSRCVLTVCWKCHVSKNKLKRSRDDGQAVVHSLLRKHRGQRTYLMTTGYAIRRGDNDRCLLMQALFASADGKDGLSEGLKVSDLVDVWLKSQKPTCDQETRQSAGIWF